jgi:hypothetical protein
MTSNCKSWSGRSPRNTADNLIALLKESSPPMAAELSNRFDELFESIVYKAPEIALGQAWGRMRHILRDIEPKLSKMESDVLKLNFKGGLLQMHIQEPSKRALDLLSNFTGWTPAFSEVRRTRAVEKARGAWQRDLYLRKMPLDDPNQWDRVIRDEIMKMFNHDEPDLLQKNRFPYNLQNCIHYILWPLNPYRTNEEVTMRLKTLLKEREFVWYVNPKPRMAEVGVHYHVFINKTD